MEISWARFQRFEGIKLSQKFEKMRLSPFKIYYISIYTSDFNYVRTFRFLLLIIKLIVESLNIK